MGSTMESDLATCTPRRARRTRPPRVPKRIMASDGLLMEPEAPVLHAQVKLAPLPHYGPKDQPCPFLVDAGRQAGPELEPWWLRQQPTWQNPWADSCAGEENERSNLAGSEAFGATSRTIPDSTFLRILTATGPKQSPSSQAWAHNDSELAPYDIDAFLKFVERGFVGDIGEDKTAV